MQQVTRFVFTVLSFLEFKNVAVDSALKQILSQQNFRPTALKKILSQTCSIRGVSQRGKTLNRIPARWKKVSVDYNVTLDSWIFYNISNLSKSFYRIAVGAKYFIFYLLSSTSNWSRNSLSLSSKFYYILQLSVGFVSRSTKKSSVHILLQWKKLVKYLSFMILLT